jgi:hypothetical protein
MTIIKIIYINQTYFPENANNLYLLILMYTFPVLMS